jgi:hypothetical protein
MRKDEVQSMLERFGFSVCLNKKLGSMPVTHMIHVGRTPERIVDYTIDEIKNTIESVWAYANESLDCIESLPDLEIWLED